MNLRPWYQGILVGVGLLCALHMAAYLELRQLRRELVEMHATQLRLGHLQQHTAVEGLAHLVALRTRAVPVSQPEGEQP